MRVVLCKCRPPRRHFEVCGANESHGLWRLSLPLRCFFRLLAHPCPQRTPSHVSTSTPQRRRLLPAPRTPPFPCHSSPCRLMGGLSFLWPARRVARPCCG